MPPKSQLGNLGQNPQLGVPVSNVQFGVEAGSADSPIKRTPGQIDWLPTGVMHPLINNGAESARFILLEFTPEPGSPTRAGVARGGVEEAAKP